MGEKTARDLAEHFGTLEKVISCVRQDKNLKNSDVFALGDIRQGTHDAFNFSNFCLDVENIGPAVSKSISDFFRNKNNLNFIRKLEKNGVVVEKMGKKKRGKFTGLNFVLTGTLVNMSREIAKDKIISFGGKVVSSVSKNTSYVVVGENPGRSDSESRQTRMSSKLQSAEKLGLKVLNEKEFLVMINKEI